VEDCSPSLVNDARRGQGSYSLIKTKYEASSICGMPPVTLDPDAVASRYASTNPCLLPAASDVPRTDCPSIRDCFFHFLEKQLQGQILESFVQTGPDWCMENGIYEFYMGATGDTVKARYSFVYVKEGDGWKIAHHHSSQIPEEAVPKAQAQQQSMPQQNDMMPQLTGNHMNQMTGGFMQFS